MDAIEALISRRSAAMLTEPGPSKEDAEILVKAAMRAPDHCNLKPWRFLFIEGEARNALGDIFAEALEKREPETTSAALEKARGKPLRAPLIIAVIAKVQMHSKVPEVEQLLSAGAAAQNIMVAAHAMGYAGIWRTGKPCFDNHVKTALGASKNDQIVGFLYLGTAIRTPAVREEPIAKFAEIWKG